MPDDFKADINAVPCDNKARLAGVKLLFAKHGAPVRGKPPMSKTFHCDE